ncbi:MAG: PLDc N-terminal domain-containing protein, partial [Rhodobacteraceae bacterium]|nr:PLDc N-terminal domain-containing protein [Paracoccaceae bacterium]
MTAFLILLHVAAQIAVIIRALLRPHREPASRMAWVMVVLLAPVVGIVA